MVIFTVKQCFHECFSGVGIEIIAKDTSGVLEVGEKFQKVYISITVFKQDIDTIAKCNLYHQDSLISPKDDFTNRVFPKKN